MNIAIAQATCSLGAFVARVFLDHLEAKTWHRQDNGIPCHGQKIKEICSHPGRDAVYVSIAIDVSVTVALFVGCPVNKRQITVISDRGRESRRDHLWR